MKSKSLASYRSSIRKFDCLIGILRRRFVVLSLGLVLLSGCSSKSANPPQKTSQAPVQQNRGVPVVVHEQAVVPPAQMSPDFAARVKSIEADARLSEMERPDFSDYKQHFAAAYELAGYAPLWLMPQGLSPQGTAVIQALENSERKGLSPADYDASKWPQRIEALKTANDTQKADFDAALTVATMRYISDLHIGRVNPKHFKFGIDAAIKKYDLPSSLRSRSFMP